MTLTVMVPLPPTMEVPDRILSPGFLRTGFDSPVNADSSTERPWDEETTPSAGTWSPIFKETASSITRSSVGTCSSLPSL